MSHFKMICQYGFIHSQCRCPNPHKTVREIQCDIPGHADAARPETDPYVVYDYGDNGNVPLQLQGFVNGLPVYVPEEGKPDKINPAHYKSSKSGVECIEVTRHMSFDLGNTTKYLWRLGQKDDNATELGKARWYLKDQLQLDEIRPAGIYIHNWPEWYQKFVAHIETVPDGHVRQCLISILNYHSNESWVSDGDRIGRLRMALGELDLAIARAEDAKAAAYYQEHKDDPEVWGEPVSRVQTGAHGPDQDANWKS